MAYTDREDLNYLGQLYLIGANQTPFLQMMGGTNTGKQTNSFLFPVAQPWALTSASQPAITEAASVTGQTAGTYIRGQDYNTVQIFQRAYEVSYAKQSSFGDISGISVMGYQPVKDELTFQQRGALLQVSVDMEYSFLQGAYQLASNATTAAKSRGLKNAITTNTVAASSALLDKTMIDTLLRTMAANGSIFTNMVILANAYQKQVLSKIYGYAPEDRNVGGLNIKQIETDFAMCGIQWCPYMPTDEIYIIDISVCSAVFLPVKGQLVLIEDKAYVGAADGGQVYTQAGLDYGPEEYHGSITGLKNT